MYIQSTYEIISNLVQVNIVFKKKQTHFINYYNKIFNYSNEVSMCNLIKKNITSTLLDYFIITFLFLNKITKKYYSLWFSSCNLNCENNIA